MNHMIDNNNWGNLELSTPRKPVNFTFYPSFANACSCHSCLIHFLVNLKNNNKKRLLGQELHVSYTTISRPRFCRITPIRKLSVLLNGMLDRNRLPPSLPLSPLPPPLSSSLLRSVNFECPRIKYKQLYFFAKRFGWIWTLTERFSNNKNTKPKQWLSEQPVARKDNNTKS